MTYYAYRHMVSFEETNLVGNVYFANYVLWQGKCREQFIADHAPEVLDDLRSGLALATVRCSCDYFIELYAFDRVEIRMRLEAASQNRIGMNFEYWRLGEDGEALAARGYQQVACMRRQDGQMAPTPIPGPLREALRAYQADELSQSAM